MNKPITLLVVDDYPFFRLGITALISASEDMEVVAEAATANEAIQLHLQFRPNITLVDLRLPDMSGVDIIRNIRKGDPSSRFIVLTMYEGDEDIYQAIEAGASGYIVKGMPSDMLLSAVRRVHSGGRFFPPAVLNTLQSRTPDANLSTRQREVLLLLAAGKNNKEIASQLYISEETVKTHVSEILLRLGVRDRTQAVLAALRRGFANLTPD
jgi:DNA-binding NarL/FixJ family response regulator